MSQGIHRGIGLQIHHGSVIEELLTDIMGSSVQARLAEHFAIELVHSVFQASQVVLRPVLCFTCLHATVHVRVKIVLVYVVCAFTHYIAGFFAIVVLLFLVPERPFVKARDVGLGAFVVRYASKQL